mmetsp:Transcript_1604/g.2651  ORF Transcript_1604/g.2651 Transcript_1604/m.2651 type:complete len:130 (-) Transcript_1604:90-479(-)
MLRVGLSKCISYSTPSKCLATAFSPSMNHVLISDLHGGLATPYLRTVTKLPNISPSSLIFSASRFNQSRLLPSTLWDAISSGIMFLKRTFQPSLIRRKRKHGFLARIQTKDGRKIINARRRKGRKSLCA